MLDDFKGSVGDDVVILDKKSSLHSMSGTVTKLDGDFVDLVLEIRTKRNTVMEMGEFTKKMEEYYKQHPEEDLLSPLYVEKNITKKGGDFTK